MALHPNSPESPCAIPAAGNAVAEPDETNNVALVAIPSGDDEESGLPGPGAVVAALALLGAARRRSAAHRRGAGRDVMGA